MLSDSRFWGGREEGEVVSKIEDVLRREMEGGGEAVSNLEDKWGF